MTETQAKSEAAGAPTDQAEPEGAEVGAVPAAAGRAAVGRATVPGETPSPKFTRAPGMAPPPDRAEDGAKAADPAATTSVASAPSAPPVTGLGTYSTSTSGQTKTTGATSSTARITTPATPRTGATGGSAGAAGASGATARPGPLGAATAVGAARVSEAVRAARSTVSGAAARGPRRARLNLKRIDPWSVMKFSLALSIVLFIVVIVATAVLYLALDTMGVFEAINKSLSDLVTSTGATGTSNGFKITAKGVIGTAALIGLVNVVLVTALATLSAFIYNVCADLVGGIEVTLAERD